LNNKKNNRWRLKKLKQNKDYNPKDLKKIKILELLFQVLILPK